MKKTLTLFIFSMLVSQIISFRSEGQCSWNTKLFDNFEYTGVCPYVIPGTTYGGSTATWTSHTGSRSLYMNFVNCTTATGQGTCLGDTFFVRPIAVCTGVDFRISAYMTTTFSGSQCDIRILIIDKNQNVLDSTTSILCAYSPVWSYYQSATFVPTTDTIYFIMTTNNPGNAGGNDLSMDEFRVENCTSFDIGSDTTICSNQSLTLNAGSGFTSYLWNNGNTMQTIVASISTPGPLYQFYSVYATDPGGCVYGDSLWVLFNNCAGINSIDVNNKFIVYPNPASSLITVKLNKIPDQACYFILYDAMGRETMKQEIIDIEQEIKLKELNSGLYLYRLIAANNSIGSGTIRLE